MEEEKQTNTIYVGIEDEIMDIIDRIKQAEEKTVTLIIPKEAVIFQDITNLKILQKRSEEMGKDVSISKAGSMDIFPHAHPAAAPVAKTQPTPPRMHHAEPKRISDMVRKSDTVDLRALERDRMEKEQEQKPAQEQELAPAVPTQAARIEEMEAAYNASLQASAPVSAPEPAPLSSLRQAAAAQKEAEKDEVFWEDLAESKLATATDRNERMEGLFDDKSRLNPKSEQTKDFDFSYPLGKKKKKKLSLLPTLSARFFAVFILICIFTASLSLFFILPKADIAIALKQEEVQGDFDFVADEKLKDIDVEAGEIPTAKTEISSTKTSTYATTSKKHVSEKATGEITILNECSTGNQVLVAGTRFLSKDGSKIFKIEETATIPGFTKPEADTVPGSKVVRVSAAETGETYNVAATTFTIPAYQEKGDWRYSCLYARSDKAMTGGSDKEVNYLSQADYDKAKTELTKAVQDENKTKVSEQKSEELVLLNDTAEEGTVEIKSSVEVNAVADNFEMTATVRKPVLSLTKADLETLLKDKIAKLNTFKNAQPVESSLTYEIGDIVNKDQKISLQVSATEKFAFDLDLDQIKRDIAGKNKEELNQYFAKMSGIKSVSVNLWPFWVSKVPEAADKVNITLDIEGGV